MIIKALDGRIIIEGDFASACAAIQACLSEANLREADLCGADLRGAYLSEADLRGADLWGANLSEAILSEANLRGADLRGADLRGADLSEAILSEANLSEADLRGAILYGAYLRWADLRGADLYGAYLSGVDLRGADLRGANLSEVKALDLSIFKICPEEGSFIGWKKLSNGVIAKLEIVERRVNATWSRKCRAESVKVLALFGQGDPVEGVGLYNRALVYRVGETVRADLFDDSPFMECSHGIHFYITRQEAEDHV